MVEKRMILIGEKESFIARVLINKVKDAGADCGFVPAAIDDIYENIDRAGLITLFLADEERPHEDVLHYLTESMEERDLQMIVVGEKDDVTYISEHVRAELIFQVFNRPVDNEAFAKTVTEYMKKQAAGELRKSILIVDDDPNFLKLIREWLKEDYKVSMVNSGLQAIKFLGKNKVDLILLDYEMPVTSGPQVLEMLRSDPETRPIPVMFLTGKGDKDSVMSVVALKPEGYFLKNIQKGELLEKLKEYFMLHK